MIPFFSVSISPLESLTVNFRENVNAVFEYLPSDMSVDEYYQENLNVLKALMIDLTLIDSNQVSIDKTKANWYIIIYRFCTVNKKVMQYIVI